MSGAQRDRESEAQRDRESEAQRDRESEAQCDRESEAQCDRESEAQRDRGASWPPVDDRGLWRWIVVAHALPLVAWAIGAAFWVHGTGVGPYRPTNPITWMAGEPLLALALYLRRGGPFAVAVVVQAVIGLVLIGTLVQAPEAFLNAGRPGSGVEDMTYLTLAVATFFAIGTGMAFVGQAAYVLRLSLSRH